MTYKPSMLIPADFDVAPSLHRETTVRTVATLAEADTSAAVAYAVASEGEVAEALGFTRDELKNLGFSGDTAQTLVIPRPGAPVAIAVGVGKPDTLEIATIRNTAAALARAASRFAVIATDLLDAAPHLDRDAAVSAIVEGAVLARYRYDALKSDAKTVALETIELVVGAGKASTESSAESSTETGAAKTGSDGDGAGEASTIDAAAKRGLTLARATMLARDLGNATPAHLTATHFGELAAALGPKFGLDVTVADKQKLIELGIGGLLGVNAGSVEEPRMITLEYRPEGDAQGHLALVGKGITYDSGGIALKPGDGMHAQMKLDMSGAGAVFAAMLALRDLGCRTAVTGYLMCTDNMPSGSAIALGEVLRIHGGKTVEVKNSDAEGRLVMSDALALAHEAGVDAVVDIATLTGAAMRALGGYTAALFGNNDALVDQVRTASAASDEDVWQLPLEKRFRDALNSDIADIANIGGSNAGATTAALFLAEFVGDTPWAHIDMAGTMASDKDDAWRVKGPTGYGARLLAELAVGFEAPAK